MTRDALKRVITSAFPNLELTAPHVVVALPRPMPIGYEGARVQDFYRGKRRDEVTWELFEREYQGDPAGSISFLTPEAARYYLPSMLNICIDYYEEADVYPLAVLSMLSGEPRTGFEGQWGKKFHSALTPEERAAICAFVQYMRDHHAADMPIVDFERLAKLYR